MLNSRTVASITGLVLLASHPECRWHGDGFVRAAGRPVRHRPRSSIPAAWTPARNYVVAPGVPRSRFPNARPADKLAIRNRVLGTIQSTWGGPRDRNRLPHQHRQDPDRHVVLQRHGHRQGAGRCAQARRQRPGHGSGEPQQGRQGMEVAAQAGWAATTTRPEFRAPARRSASREQCRGACRGRGGTPHSKYFLFNNVGSQHVQQHRHAELDEPDPDGVPGPVEPGADVVLPDDLQPLHGDLPRDPRRYAPVGALPPLHRRQRHRHLLPRPGTTATDRPGDAGAEPDPVHRFECGRQRAGPRIRVIQYAIYDSRGVWIAKKLRSLWNAGCDVRIIYSISTRPVLRDPAQRLRPRRDPDEAVGDHEPQARDREVQPQQVDDDRRQLGRFKRGVRHSPVRPTGATPPSPTTSRCSRSARYGAARSTISTSTGPGPSGPRTHPGYGIKGSEGRLLPPG